MKRYIKIICLLLSIGVFSQEKWTLQQSIDYAIRNNLQVGYYQKNQKLEQKNLQISKNEYLPIVSSAFHNSLKFGQTQGFQGGIGRNDNFSNGLTISASMLLYNGNRLQKEVNKKTYDLAVAGYNTEVVKNNISLQIIQQYLSINLNKELLKVHQSALENSEKTLERAKITTEIGTTARTILAEAEASVSKEKQNLKQAEIEIKRSLFGLAQLLQLKDYHNFDISEEDLGENSGIALLSLEEIIAESLSWHPQIKASEYNIKSVEEQTKIVKTAHLPSVSLSAGIGSFYYNSLVTDIAGVYALGNYIKEATLFKQYKDNFYQQVGLSVNIPIFNKGNTKIQVEQSRIREDLAKQDLAVKRQELIERIQKVYFDKESYYEVMKSSIEAERNLALALDFAEKSYGAGKTSIYELNTARNNLVGARSSVIQARYNYIYQMKLLEFYIGGK